ncbi:sigma-54-dependent Fis family transcriptional regulator [Pedobacter hiemivivus]|uniref:Sigma-54-dependent Fis family transcriptional regulator n=1 Tax=Pedobacter hiemivivus TaxID=2530454 RepID=A0A4U1GDV8_9SPHI|nr:sigma-54 dependent transcriptional regulator [Pedobacter hiemivivus]TKC62227.1 sigma-54-dependent Fis family transcriptional regulator [Pedobacter hiemivivus]
MKTRILIVEDQFIKANNLRIILSKAGYHVCTIACSVNEALKIVEREKPDLVLLDIRLQGRLTGIDLAKSLKEKNIGFVYLSANSDKKTLDAAKETSPYGFIAKPFRAKDVLVMLDVAWYLHQQNHPAVSKELTDRYRQAGIKEIITSSEKMLTLINHLKIAGTSDISVLILGESGTGKELAAQYIHINSLRSTKPFVVVNCGALPANLIESELFGHEKGSFTGANEKRIGKFEQANDGTVFLDEIGELPLDLQVKLLRVLQEREVEPIGGKKRTIDVRIIAASNRMLEEEVAAGRFRLDLYYRLNVFPVLIPPLRERKQDLKPLADHFLKFYAKKENKNVSGISDAVFRSMQEYSWPGNIRELENMIARSVLLTNGNTITSLQLPSQPSSPLPMAITNGRIKTMAETEHDHILIALESCGWKIHGRGGAAELLDLNASTLISRMKKLGIAKSISFKKAGQKKI